MFRVPHVTKNLLEDEAGERMDFGVATTFIKALNTMKDALREEFEDGEVSEELFHENTAKIEELIEEQEG